MWNRIQKFISALAEGFIIGNAIIANGGGVRIERAL